MAVTPEKAAQEHEAAANLLESTAKAGLASLSTVQTNNLRLGSYYLEVSKATFDFAADGAHALAQHAQKVKDIRDPKDAWEVQTDFVRARYAALQDYLTDITKLAGTLSSDTKRR